MVGQLTLGKGLPGFTKRNGETVELPTGVASPQHEQSTALTGDAPSHKPGWSKKLLVGALAASVLIGATVGGYAWVQYLSTHEDTDDAYTVAHVHAISTRIDGTVQKVLVDDNEHVTAGEPLVILDPRDYQMRVDQAKAALSVAENQAQSAKELIALAETTSQGKTREAQGSVSDAASSISKAEASVIEAQAAVPEAQAQLAQRQAEEQRAEGDYARYQQLAGQRAVTLQARDNALKDMKVAQAATKAAQEVLKEAAAKIQESLATVSMAKAQLVQSQGQATQAKATIDQTQVSKDQYATAVAQIGQAVTQLNDAQLQLSYTTITAPIDGRVGKKSVEEGQRVQPGQQLMAVVADDTWVVANFKETQLEHMRPGQHVSIKVDSFPHHAFDGTVDSFSPGSGSTFAMLPSDNATGNFTKIVQRIPVKITFDKLSIKGFEQMIVPGMSAVVTVSTAH